MKKVLLLSVIISLCSLTAAIAVPKGKVLEFTHSPMGTVKFSGEIHQAAGVKCKECHNKDAFPKMKFGTVKVTMAEIYAGKLCGICHNGQRAFDAKANCNRCHIKQ